MPKCTCCTSGMPHRKEARHTQRRDRASLYHPPPFLNTGPSQPRPSSAHQGPPASVSRWWFEQLFILQVRENAAENCWPEKKKSTTWELWIQSDLGPNEDCSLGNGLSDSSEELFWRGEGQSVHMWLWWQGMLAGKHTSWQKVAASHQKQMSPLMILMLFLMWEDARHWAHKIWKYLTIWRLFCWFVLEHRVPHSWSPPWIPFRCGRSVTAVASDIILEESSGERQFLVNRTHNDSCPHEAIS